MYSLKVGKEYTIEEAQKIAEVIAVSLLKTVQVNIGMTTSSHDHLNPQAHY
jgi:uncharacterized protein (UPF0254 family)